MKPEITIESDGQVKGLENIEFEIPWPSDANTPEARKRFYDRIVSVFGWSSDQSGVYSKSRFDLPNASYVYPRRIGSACSFTYTRTEFLDRMSVRVLFLPGTLGSPIASAIGKQIIEGVSFQVVVKKQIDEKSKIKEMLIFEPIPSIDLMKFMELPEVMQVYNEPIVLEIKLRHSPVERGGSTIIKISDAFFRAEAGQVYLQPEMHPCGFVDYETGKIMLKGRVSYYYAKKSVLSDSTEPPLKKDARYELRIDGKTLFCMTPPEGMTAANHLKSFRFFIEELRMRVYARTATAIPGTLIISSDLIDTIKNMEGFVAGPTPKDESAELSFLGYLSGVGPRLSVHIERAWSPGIGCLNCKGHHEPDFYAWFQTYEKVLV